MRTKRLLLGLAAGALLVSGCGPATSDQGAPSAQKQTTDSGQSELLRLQGNLNHLTTEYNRIGTSLAAYVSEKNLVGAVSKLPKLQATCTSFRSSLVTTDFAHPEVFDTARDLADTCDEIALGLATALASASSNGDIRPAAASLKRLGKDMTSQTAALHKLLDQTI